MKSLVLLLSTFGFAVCWNNGQGRTPPMGWTATYAYNLTTLTDEIVRNTTAYLSKSGLSAAGYKYVNLGDMWMS